jgi:gamma-glutamylcyclotransferase (GGCT)/AIG2-like uncharacterized protein YtfP
MPDTIRFKTERWNRHPNDVAKLRTLVHTALTSSANTPDASVLQKKSSHLVFVYGTLKKGFSNHTYLAQRSTPIGIGFTRYKLLMRRVAHPSYTYPVLTYATGADIEKRASIYGELWNVPTPDMFLLDNLESNGVMYKRLPMPISAAIGHTSTNTQHTEVRAWVYLGLRDFWDSSYAAPLKDCDILTRNKDQLPYYSFMRKYEEECAGHVRSQQGTSFLEKAFPAK